MFIQVQVGSSKLRIPTGDGHNNIRWLATVACMRYCCGDYPHKFVLASGMFRHPTGDKLRPRTRIRDCLQDNEVVSLILDDPSDRSKSSWFSNAFGKRGYLCELAIEWVSSSGIIPKSVSGVLSVNSAYTHTYPLSLIISTSSDQLEFNVPLEPVPTAQGGYRWIGYLRCPPGIAKFHFIGDSNQFLLCDSLARSADGQWHEMKVVSDLPETPSSEIPVIEKFTNGFIFNWNSIPYREEYVPFKSVLSNVFTSLESIYMGIARLRDTVEVQDMYFLLHAFGETPDDFLKAYSGMADPSDMSTVVSMSCMVEFVLMGLSRGKSGTSECVSVLDTMLDRGRSIINIISALMSSHRTSSLLVSDLHTVWRSCTEKGSGRFNVSIQASLAEGKGLKADLSGYSFLEFLGLIWEVSGGDVGSVEKLGMKLRA